MARRNIKASADNEIFYYYSGCGKLPEISEAIKNQTAKLLFISPEALIKNEQFQALVNEANESRYLKNIIVDEAHIVVAWGDFFRVDYQCLGPWRRELMRTNPDIKTFLLSATFKDDTVRTLKKIFSAGGKWIELRCDSLRKEPHYIMVMANGYKDKKRKVLNIVNLMPKPMILYVNAPYEAEKWKEYLQFYGYSNIKTFTGDTKSDDRLKLIDQWSDNQYEIMIATSAFGVGVDNETIKRQIRELCRSPQPERKAEFFQYIKHQGLVNKRSFRLSQGEFLAGQIAYIEKRIWLLSAFLLLFITWICRHSSGNYPFALTPFLASGILAQTRRSFHWKMAEMEYAARFSLRSVILARMFLLGAADTAGLMIVILLVRPCFSYSLTRVFLYMMVPYLTASWLGSVYERKQRTDHGWGSVLICFLSSAAFAAAPVFFERLYEERLTVIWAAVFALLTFSLAGSIREWICGMEEPVWN